MINPVYFRAPDRGKENWDALTWQGVKVNSIPLLLYLNKVGLTIRQVFGEDRKQKKMWTSSEVLVSEGADSFRISYVAKRLQKMLRFFPLSCLTSSLHTHCMCVAGVLLTSKSFVVQFILLCICCCMEKVLRFPLATRDTKFRGCVYVEAFLFQPRPGLQSWRI